MWMLVGVVLVAAVGITLYVSLLPNHSIYKDLSASRPEYTDYGFEKTRNFVAGKRWGENCASGRWLEFQSSGVLRSSRGETGQWVLSRFGDLTMTQGAQSQTSHPSISPELNTFAIEQPGSPEKKYLEYCGPAAG
jgi:hypothetical protein